MEKFTQACRLSLFICCLFAGVKSHAQGTWVPVTHPCPDYADGVSLLLSDGTVMVKVCRGGVDTLGNQWDRLTPDTNGSYANGTWTHMPSMTYTRLFCSSQVLKDGRVYVAGGEYGTGSRTGEIYDPVANTWTNAGELTPFSYILDGNSQLLPDGKVLQNVVEPNSLLNCIFDPVTNTYSRTASSFGGSDEAAWLLLPDNSILFIEIGSVLTDRYIPSLGRWVHDGIVPDSLYDLLGYELGAGFLLPDGRAFFIGSLPVTAYYTPTGDTTMGTWTAGPAIPNNLGGVDAAAAMMPNGKILCALSPQADSAYEFQLPAWFYEFDYLTNTFTEVSACAGGDTMDIRCSETGMLDLPDGNIFVSVQNSNQYYVYEPGGTPVASGTPVINKITMLNCDTFMATGTLFNGISQGAAYGDDWQMPTNYPVIRLVHHDSVLGDLVHYARTFNWNSTGVMTGSQADTTYFTLPAGLPYGTYDLVVVANGIASAPQSFTPCYTAGVAQTQKYINGFINVYPNPASGQATVAFTSVTNGTYNVKLVDVLGQTISNESGISTTGTTKHVLHLNGLPTGIYSVVLQQDNSVYTAKLVVE